MTDQARSAITLTVLAVALVGSVAWGWSAVTKPFPGKIDAPICVDRTVERGTRVFPQDVTVSVYNAGTREGLAGLTMQRFTDHGFAEGTDGNVAGVRVSRVQIWSDQPDNPAVQLVASWLGRGVEVVKRGGLGPGVDVVVGDRFRDLVRGKRSVVASADTTICSPPID